MSGEERIKTWCIYTMEHYSAIKRDKSEPFAETRMDLEAVIESVSQREKDRYHIISLTC